MDSLQRLIADGLVIQTEFSHPKKRQASPLQYTRHHVSEVSRRTSKSPIKNEPYKSPVRDWKHHAQRYEIVRTLQLVEDNPTPEVTPETRRIWQQWKPETVEERLLRLERERQNRLTVMRNHAQQRETDFPFTPTVNPSSLPRPEDVSLQLYEQGLEDKRKKLLLQESPPNPQFPLTPALEKSPIRRTLTLFSKSKVSLRDFLSRNYWSQIHRNRCNLSHDCSLDSDCIFHPQINASYTERSNGDVYERLVMKQRQAESKRYEKGRGVREREKGECTFQPKVGGRTLTPPANTRKSPLKSEKLIGDWMYSDQKHVRHTLSLKHCSGNWMLLAELEKVEERIQALGVHLRQ